MKLQILGAIAACSAIALLALTATARADEKEIGLRGLVECGIPSETRCALEGSFGLRTSEISGSEDLIQVDVTWIPGHRLPAIDQDDDFCVTGFIRGDGVLQATTLDEFCSAGTPNEQREKERRDDERKEKDKN